MDITLFFHVEAMQCKLVPDYEDKNFYAHKWDPDSWKVQTSDDLVILVITLGFKNIKFIDQKKSMAEI